jgi:small subunit ribosomal protein S21
MLIEDNLEFKHLEVEVKNDNVDEAIRRFKQMVQKEGILLKLKEKSRYEKPSVKKRRKKREAIANRFLADLRERQMLSGEWDAKQKRKEQKRIEKNQKKEKAKKELGE